MIGDEIVRHIMIKFIFMLIYLVLVQSLPFGEQVNYEEVRALGGTCPSTDTCESREDLEDNLFGKTCECKPSCNKYGTCCVDSPNNRMYLSNATASWPNTPEESCHYLMGAHRTLIVKHKCKPSWHGNQEIKSQCEAISYSPVYEDPLASIPVTNTKTSTTYKNYFCVLCNEDDADDLVFWNVEVTKYMPESEYEKAKRKFENKSNKPPLIFNNVTKEWGTMETIEGDPEVDSMATEVVKEGSDQKVFENVYMFFKFPPSVRESIIGCSSNLISECHPDWKDETVRRKCHSYMGMIYGEMPTPNGFSSLERFRNVHCAICNFAGNSSNLKCLISGSGSGEKTMSLSWLLDVNLSSGDKVGESRRCSSTEVYDPFFKKCRTMVCVKPGYKVKDGKCAPS